MKDGALEVSLAAPHSTGLPMAMWAIAIPQEPRDAVDGALALLSAEVADLVRSALEHREFRAGRDEEFLLSGGSGQPRRILLVGMGKPADFDVALKRAASIAARRAKDSGAGTLVFVSSGNSRRATECEVIGLLAGHWSYTELRTPPPEVDRRAPLTRAVIVTTLSDGAKAGLADGLAIGTGQSLARTLGMMPGNYCTPEFLASTAEDIASRHGMKCSVLGRTELEAEGMGSMLCVAQGTPQDPKLMVLEYAGGNTGDAPVVLIGKGLCFDSGGISIKPAQSMELMKYDMSGGGAVLGAMEAIGRIRPRVNVVGIVGATTNMPSGTAVKPGDVVRSHSGRFIEIINTDAEGRLVLADLLSYAKRFSPAAVIDAATLTGAVVIALGNVATGLFSTDAGLTSELVAAGKRAGEPSWELPLWEDFRELIKSDVADVKNSGGRAASSITAALFLKDFAEGYPWVHMDIAGTAYSESDLTSIPRGPTGNPVCTFVEFIRARAG